MQRTGDDCGWFSRFQFCFDPRDPFDISLVNKARGNLGSLFPQVCVPGPERSSVSFSPRAAHPGKFARTTLGLIEGIAEKEFAITVRQSAENRHMLIDGFKTVYLLPRLPGAGHEVIVQAMRGRHIAGISGVNK